MTTARTARRRPAPPVDVVEELPRDVVASGSEPLGPTDTVSASTEGTAAEGPRLRPASALLARPERLTLVGLGLVVTGCLLLLVAWGKTAGAPNVGLQMPYLASAGLGGLALIAIGLTAVSLGTRLGDAQRKEAQLDELTDVLAQVRRKIEGL